MRKFSLFLLCALMLGFHASAQQVIFAPGPLSTPISIPGISYFGDGPITFGPELTYTADNANNSFPAAFGYIGGYGLGSYGTWYGTGQPDSVGPMIATDSAFYAAGETDSITLSFAGLTQEVGGFFNYAPPPSVFYTPTTIAAYDASGDLLASYLLTLSTPDAIDAGIWVGFSTPTPEIKYITMTGNYVAVAQLSYVPEGGSNGLYLLVGVVICAAAVRIKSRAEASESSVLL